MRAVTDIAWRNLVRERTRLAVSVGGVAFAVVLILLLRGIYTGVNSQASAYVRSVDADVWVGQAATKGGFFDSVSVLPLSLGPQLAALPGVERATPVLGRPVVAQAEGKEVRLYLIGVDPTGVGGPPEVDSGARVAGPGEVVIDRVFARENGLGVGDQIELRDTRLRVVGIARGGNAIVTQYAWARLADVARLVDAPDIANYFVVKARPGTNAEALARAISSALPSTAATPADEFVYESTDDIRQGFLPIVWVLVVIAFIVGTAVIGLTVYTATLEKRREYGVLKAIGFSNRRLLVVVWRQSFIAAGLGLAVGIALSLLAGRLLEQAVPSFVTDIRSADLALVTAAVAGMSALASFLPVRPVIRLDPAQVFRV